MPGHSNVTRFRRATSDYMHALRLYLGALCIIWRACSLRQLRERKARRCIKGPHSRRIHRRALMKLGGACACCGLRADAFALALNIHHINHNGTEHRRLLGMSGLSVSLWVLATDNPRAEPFPVEALCVVCHQLTHQLGQCPHRHRTAKATPAAKAA